MSIFDRFLKVSESDRISSIHESQEFLNELLSGQEKFVDMSGHSKYIDPETRKEVPDTYRFTVKLLSLDILIKLSKDKRVKNVFFAARHSHPGGASDSASLRQRIIVQYY